MASFKSTAVFFLVLIALGAAGAGGAYVYLQLQQRAAERDLTLAEGYLKQGQAAQADQVLAARLESASKRAPWRPRALALRLEALDRLQDTAGLRALASRILDPQNPLAGPPQEAWARAEVILGQAALEAKNVKEARERFEAVLAQSAATAGHAPAVVGLARLEMADAHIPAARERLAALLPTLAPDDPARPSVEQNLGQCNLAMLMSREPYGQDQIYVLQSGDTLDALGRRFKISPEILKSINQIPDERRLPIGRRLKIPDVAWSIVVNKSDNTLTLLNHDQFFKKYRVRTGEIDYMTPTGDFRIENKTVDPAWVNPKDNQRYPPGDPGNQLGCRWMGFQGSNLGIHEAIDPETLGKYSSNGCVGMAKSDVIELYDLVPRLTPVKIIGQIQKPL